MLTRMFRNFRNRGLRTQPTLLSVILNNSQVYLPLTHTAVPTRGSITPTFTRATTETGQKWDEAGYLDFTALAGEIVFKGARRVRNVMRKSEDFSGAEFTKTNCTVAKNLEGPDGVANSACTVTATGASALLYDTQGITPASCTKAITSVYLKRITGTGTVRISANGANTNVTVALTTSWQRFEASATTLVSGTFPAILIATSGDLIGVAFWQEEDVTGQADQTASEYVSVGVESAPAYHGSMVDGVKCYDTDRSGNPITQTTTYDAVTLNGVAGTYVSTPDSVAASITGDIDIRVKAALTDWTPAALVTLVSKWDSGSTKSYMLNVEPGGTLSAFMSPDGSATNNDVYSTTATGFSDGTAHWCRVVRVAATGGVTFYTSSDGDSWTQLGTPVAGVAGDIFDSTSIVEIGSLVGGVANNASGKIYRAQIYNGIDGTLAVDFDASRYAGGTTLTGSTGETWTLNGSAIIRPTNYPLVGYVPWEARTNLCLQSNALTTTPWANQIGTCAPTQNAIGPDGATSAWTLTDNDGAATEVYGANSGVLTAASYTFSIFVAKTSGAQSSYPVVLMYDGTALRISAATIDTTNGIATIWTSYTGWTAVGTAACVSHNDDFWRVALTFTASTNVGVINLVPAGALTPTLAGPAFEAAAQGSAVFYGAQLELGSFASTYIPTTTAAVTRAADSDTYPTAGNFSDTAGTMYAEVTYDVWANAVGSIVGSATQGMLPTVNGTKGYDGTNTVTDLNYSPSGTIRMAVSWDGSTMTVAAEGADTVSGAYDGAWNLSSIGIGLGSFSTIRNVRIWNRALSDTELISITSAVNSSDLLMESGYNLLLEDGTSTLLKG